MPSQTTPKKTQKRQSAQHVEKTLEREEPRKTKRASGSNASGSNASGSNASGSRSASRSASKSGASKSKQSTSQAGVHEHRTAKVIEIVCSSTKSFDDAIQNGVRDASRSLHNIHGCEVQNMSLTVQDGKIAAYKVDLKLAFGVDQAPSP